MNRNSARARRICFDTHAKRDDMSVYLVCHCCGVFLRLPKDANRWRADHIRRHAEGGTDEADNLWPICLPCDTGKEGKAATDTREVAKGKRVAAKHYGTAEKSKRGFRGWRTFDGRIVWRQEP